MSKPAKMEDWFTHCLSFNKLRANSVMDLISALRKNKLTY